MAKVEGLDRFKRRLSALPAAARQEMAGALDESADRLMNLQRALAPTDDGTLRASIRKEPGDHELQVRVRAGGPTTTKPVRQGLTAPAADYALIQEFGTEDHPAQPFFFPAFRALRRTIRNRLARAYRAAARRAGGRS
jgi:HK97 gp10 family phage protein